MQEPIRILHMLASMNRGGAEAMIMNYYRHINTSKVQFDFLLTTPGRYDYEDEILQLGGRISRIRPLTKARPWEYMQDVDRFFKSHPQYRVVHSHTSSKSYFPLKIAKKNHIPVRIAHSHSSKAESGINGLIRKALRIPLRTVATDFFACGEEAALYLYGKKLAQKKAVVVPNAIDATRYSYNAQQARKMRQDLGLEGRFVVGHVGRFFPVKNHMFLIDVFHAVKQKRPDSCLLLVGEGELMEPVKEKVRALGLERDVRFTGVRSDVPELLWAMDVFVFPSLNEGIPVTMIEAQAAGLQCVMSDSIPAQCVITQNVKQMPLTRPPEDWAAEILRFQNGYVRRDMCAQVAQAGFDIQKNVKWLEEFYLHANACVHE